MCARLCACACITNGQKWSRIDELHAAEAFRTLNHVAGHRAWQSPATNTSHVPSSSVCTMHWMLYISTTSVCVHRAGVCVFWGVWMDWAWEDRPCCARDGEGKHKHKARWDEKKYTFIYIYINEYTVKIFTLHFFFAYISIRTLGKYNVVLLNS